MPIARISIARARPNVALAWPRAWRSCSRHALSPSSKARTACTPRTVHSIASAGSLASPSAPAVASRRTSLRDALLRLDQVAGSVVAPLRLDQVAGAAVAPSPRLQLACTGLATEQATIRIGVSSFGPAALSGRLVKLLLADPLQPEQEWERLVEGSAMNGALGRLDQLLVRYGDTTSYTGHPQPLPVLQVPSQVLRDQKVEVLISRITAAAATTTTTAATTTTTTTTTTATTATTTTTAPSADPANPVLEPRLLASTANRLVTLPVHAAIVYLRSLDDVVSYGRLSAQHHTPPPHAVQVLFQSADTVLGHDQAGGEVSAVVNVERGNEALRSIRESADNAIMYEKDWYGAGLPRVTDWFRERCITGQGQGQGHMRPAIRDLISSIAAEYAEQVAAAQMQYAQQQDSLHQGGLLQRLRADVAVWAEGAHRELRDSLEPAFTTGSWQRIRWWKLLWQLDDVGACARELVRSRWLVTAERNMLYLTRRLEETRNGQIQRPQTSTTPNRTPYERSMDEAGSTLGSPIAQLAADRVQLEASCATVQVLGQRHLAGFVGTTTMSAALGTLLATSVSGLDWHDGGAVAALGLVWACRRLQKRWHDTRRAWEDDARELGRQTIRRTERRLAGIVDDIGGPTTAPVDFEAANTAIDNVRRLAGIEH